MTESEGNNQELIQYWWEVIKSSGCSHLQDVIKGRKPSDFDPEELRKQAEFVLTSYPDAQSSYKKPLPPIPFSKKKPQK